jgi:hypothetical protein
MISSTMATGLDNGDDVRDRGDWARSAEELLRAIHGQSRRRQRALVKVNHGAVPPSLIDSEVPDSFGLAPSTPRLASS